MEGLNSCVFAYGQTGSGKTHTMLGDVHPQPGGALSHLAGLTPRIFQHLLSRIRDQTAANTDAASVKYECRVSFLEIYNECVMDLLNPESTNLNMREDTNAGIYVEGVSEQSIHTGAAACGSGSARLERKTNSAVCLWNRASIQVPAAPALLHLWV